MQDIDEMSQALSAAIATVDGASMHGITPSSPTMASLESPSMSIHRVKSNPVRMPQVKQSHSTARASLARGPGSTKHQPAIVRSGAFNAEGKTSFKFSSSGASSFGTCNRGESDNRCAAAKETMWADGSDHGEGDSDEPAITSTFSEPRHGSVGPAPACAPTTRARIQDPVAILVSEDPEVCCSNGGPPAELPATILAGTPTRTAHADTISLTALLEDEYLELMVPEFLLGLVRHGDTFAVPCRSTGLGFINSDLWGQSPLIMKYDFCMWSLFTDIWLILGGWRRAECKMAILTDSPDRGKVSNCCLDQCRSVPKMCRA